MITLVVNCDQIPEFDTEYDSIDKLLMNECEAEEALIPPKSPISSPPPPPPESNESLILGSPPPSQGLCKRSKTTLSRGLASDMNKESKFSIYIYSYIFILIL